MAPLLKRSWALRGKRPIFKQRGRPQKVSVAGALCINPTREKIGLFYVTLINDYFDNCSISSFLRALQRELSRKVVVVWDGGPIHSGEFIREIEAKFKSKIMLEKLPPYAPMINPVEFVWNWLKYGQLSNFAPTDAWALDRRVHMELEKIQNDHEALCHIWKLSKLPIPRTLLS
jgi:putative transposase